MFLNENCISVLGYFQPLGASDYLEISRLFDTVFIRHIPLLTLNKKTQARRLITLVDTLYEHKVCLSHYVCLTSCTTG